MLLRSALLLGCLLATAILLIFFHSSKDSFLAHLSHSRVSIWAQYNVVSPGLDKSVAKHDEAFLSPSTKGPLNLEPSSGSSQDILQVAITETCGCHDEVLAALVHSFGTQRDVHLSIYQKEQRFGIADILAAFELAHPLQLHGSPEVFINDTQNTPPHIIVSTTCEYDIVGLQTRLTVLLEAGKTYLFCVVHHMDRWTYPSLAEAAIPWVEKGLISFVSLSPHTAIYLDKNVISGWQINNNASILVLPPVFHISLPPITKSDIDNESSLCFALQGNYETERRDYAHIFDSLSSFNEPGFSADQDSRNISIHLLGHGDHPLVPTKVADLVHFDEDLSYTEFYNILSRSSALLPAFATDEYYEMKASSSVPAALIAGIPLIATRRLLEAYSYLSAEVLYLQEEEESDMDVVRRILESTAAQRLDKATKVRMASDDLVRKNVELVGRWIADAELRLRQVGIAMK